MSDWRARLPLAGSSSSPVKYVYCAIISLTDEVVLSIRRTTLGDCAFSVAAEQFWNQNFQQTSFAQSDDSICAVQCDKLAVPGTKITKLETSM